MAKEIRKQINDLWLEHARMNQKRRRLEWQRVAIRAVLRFGNPTFEFSSFDKPTGTFDSPVCGCKLDIAKLIDSFKAIDKEYRDLVIGMARITKQIDKLDQEADMLVAK